MPATDITELSSSEQTFLDPYLPSPSAPSASGKSAKLPFVTLTYACSLDGMIALAPGVRTALSGPETKSMTHYLRLKHDAILVGAGTAVADLPSLNCRYPGAEFDEQPQPVIVDPRRRWKSEGSALGRLAEEGKGRQPWAVSLGGNSDEACKRLVVEESEGGRMDWETVLRKLKAEGIRSVMVEGGATVINALLAEPGLVDSVIVTIAPTWLGQGGLAACPAVTTVNGRRVNAARLADTTWRQFGADAVLCGRLGA